MRLSEVVSRREKAVKSYERRRELAEELAKVLGVPVAGGHVVGRVSYAETVEASEIPVDVPPEVWISVAHEVPQLLSEGYYYAVIDPKTLSLILAVVSGASRSSIAQRHEVPVYVPIEEVEARAAAPLGLTAVRIVLRPLVLVHLGVEGAERLLRGSDLEVLTGLPTSSPSTPPDPGSPVVVPRIEVVEALLSCERGDGVPLGGLAIMDQLYVAGGYCVPMVLPWKAMVKHVLVTGTTGSGKTSLVKNVVYVASRQQGVRVVILDANGDYVASLLPGYVPASLVDGARALVLRQVYGVHAEPGKPVAGHRLRGLIVIPCTGDPGECRSAERRREVVEDYAERLRRLAEGAYKHLVSEKCTVDVRVLGSLEKQGLPMTYRIRVALGQGCGELSRASAEVYVVLCSIEVGDKVPQLVRVDPYLTERAKEELRRVWSYYLSNKPKGMKPCLADFADWLAAHGVEVQRELHVHRETLANLQRRTQALKACKIVDTGALPLDYSKLAEYAERLGVSTVILDLEYAEEKAPEEVEPKTVKVLLGYRVLQTLLSYAERGKKEKYIVVVVDEAHLFFPSREEGYGAVLAAQLERLARLGRSRGVSLILSTHREEDVSPLVASLANTKVYLRADQRTAEKLPLPTEYKKKLPTFADHAAVVFSYVLRGGYATIVGAPAVVGHRTV